MGLLFSTTFCSGGVVASFIVTGRVQKLKTLNFKLKGMEKG